MPLAMTLPCHHQLQEAYEQIEATILPCLTMVLGSLLDAAAGVGESDPKALAAELRMLAAEIDGLTQAVERSAASPGRTASLQHVA